MNETRLENVNAHPQAYRKKAGGRRQEAGGRRL